MALKLAGPILGTIFLVVVSALDYYRWHDKRTKRFKTLRAVLFALLGLALAIACVQIIGDDRAQRADRQALSANFDQLKGQNADEAARAQDRAGNLQAKLATVIEGNRVLRESLVAGTFRGTC